MSRREPRRPPTPVEKSSWQDYPTNKGTHLRRGHRERGDSRFADVSRTEWHWSTEPTWWVSCRDDHGCWRWEQTWAKDEKQDLRAEALTCAGSCPTHVEAGTPSSSPSTTSGDQAQPLRGGETSETTSTTRMLGRACGRWTPGRRSPGPPPTNRHCCCTRASRTEPGWRRRSWTWWSWPRSEGLSASEAGFPNATRRSRLEISRRRSTVSLKSFVVDPPKPSESSTQRSTGPMPGSCRWTAACRKRPRLGPI